MQPGRSAGLVQSMLGHIDSGMWQASGWNQMRAFFGLGSGGSRRLLQALRGSSERAPESHLAAVAVRFLGAWAHANQQRLSKVVV